MTLLWLILVPLAAGLLAWLPRGRHEDASRWISLAALGVDLVLALGLWRGAAGGGWLAEHRWEWIPRFGISLHLGADGLSLLLVVLTLFLGVLSVLASWSEVTERVGFFHFNLMWILAGILGVFLALDLFLFYFFWELMLVPMYLLIGIWGHERRIYASFKFFIFTQAGGLLMLLAILGLVFAHRQETGVLSFDYADLLGTDTGTLGIWLFLGFAVAFLVKLPAVPLHTWLPDAHTEAPTAGSVVLAGLLLKTGAYGLLRFALPLFPREAEKLAPGFMVLGAVGVLYGAALAFAQTDLKRLVAYSSVSHLGFVLLGVFAWNQLALQGAVMTMICHGLSTGALFVLVGQIKERIGSRDLGDMGGFAVAAPRMAALATFFAMASLGLPGLGNFVGELLVLIGAFQASVAITAVAALGLVGATIYALWIVQKAFHGPLAEGRRVRDLGPREVATLGAMAVALVWLGLYPQPVLEMAQPAVEALAALALDAVPDLTAVATR